MQHPCFVSYVHPSENWTLEVTSKVLAALSNALSAYTRIPICYDRERMKPSYNHEEVLATDICQSACMVVLYYPAYLESDYCLRELEAMRDIEARRQQLLGSKLRGRRMFLPILLRGNVRDLPEYVYERNTPLDYSKQLLTTVDISKTSEVREKLLKSAEAIHETYRILKAENLSAIDCQAYALPPAAPAGDLAAAAVPFPNRQ